MADTDTTLTAPAEGATTKKKGGLGSFIRKNKTLSVVVAGVGGYLFWKLRSEPVSGGEASSEEGGVTGNEEGAIDGTAADAAYEVGRAERRVENAESNEQELEEEKKEQEEKRKQERKEREEAEEEARGSQQPEEPETQAGPTPEPAAKSGVTLHGKTFSGATGSHIAKAGKTEGNKAYIEYAINFPGSVEHWQYFTATKNWRQVSNSGAGAAANNGKQSGSGTPTGGTAGKQTGASTAAPSVAQAQALPAAKSVKEEHPNAVGTGNPCVNGGVGGHTPPKGYHLFCAKDGMIYRAPN